MNGQAHDVFAASVLAGIGLVMLVVAVFGQKRR